MTRSQNNCPDVSPVRLTRPWPFSNGSIFIVATEDTGRYQGARGENVRTILRWPSNSKIVDGRQASEFNVTKPRRFLEDIRKTPGKRHHTKAKRPASRAGVCLFSRFGCGRFGPFPFNAGFSSAPEETGRYPEGSRKKSSSGRKQLSRFFEYVIYTYVYIYIYMYIYM